MVKVLEVFIREGDLITSDMILPRKSVEGLFGYSGLWLWGDSKSSGDLYPRAECKRIRL